MIETLKKHTGYYASLMLFLVVGLFLALSASNDRSLQKGVLLGMAFVYVLWGIIHHRLYHDLSAKIVVEYVLIGGFGITVIFSLLG